MAVLRGRVFKVWKELQLATDESSEDIPTRHTARAGPAPYSGLRKTLLNSSGPASHPFRLLATVLDGGSVTVPASALESASVPQWESIGGSSESDLEAPHCQSGLGGWDLVRLMLGQPRRL